MKERRDAKLGLAIAPPQGEGESMVFEVRVCKGANVFHPRKNPKGTLFTQEELVRVLEKNRALWTRTKGTLGGITLKKTEDAFEFRGFYPFPINEEEEFKGLGIGAVMELFVLRHLDKTHPEWLVGHGTRVSDPREKHVEKMGIPVSRFLTVRERLRRVTEYVKQRFD